MAEYIERGALIKGLERTQSFLKPEIYEKVIKGIVINNAIEKAPTINPESLRPHGRWIICSDGYYPYCSACFSEPKGGMSKFCPNCGAKMDLEENK